MNNVFGITGIQVKAIEVNKNDVTEVNDFLEEYDGNIIDVQIIPMFQGVSRFVIVYKAVAFTKEQFEVDKEMDEREVI